MPTPDALTFTFVLFTNVWQAEVPHLSLAECNWMVQSAPMVVAQQERFAGYPLEFEHARCIAEER